MLRMLLTMIFFSLTTTQAIAGSSGTVGALITTDPAMGEDQSLEMTLAVIGALQSVSGRQAVPYVKLTKALGFMNAEQPGTCIKDLDCIRRVKQELGLDVLVIGTMNMSGPELLTVMFRRIERDPLLRFSRTRTISRDPVALVKNLREMAREMLRPPAPVLVTSGPGRFDVLVDGSRVGEGPGTFLISAGNRTVTLKKGDSVLMEKKIACAVAGRCSLGIPMPKQPKVIKRTEIRYVSSTPFPWKRYTGYTLSAAGVALIVLAVLDGSEAARIADELDQLCAGPICDITLDEAQGKAARGADLATRANWFLAGGGLALAGGISLVILDAISPTKSTVTSPEGASEKLDSSLRFTPTPTGIWVQYGLRF